MHPQAAPLSVPARPELTGGRRVGVLLSHGFTGQPASVKPWGEHLAALGYAVEVPRLPGHGTTWQEMNRTTWVDWYGELTRVFDRLCLDNDAVVVGGLSMGGALSLPLAAEHPDRVPGVVVVNPAVATKRFDVKPAARAQASCSRRCPASSTTSRRRGRPSTATPGSRCEAAATDVRRLAGVTRELPKVTAPLLYFRSTVDHVVDELSEPLITGSVSSRDVPSYARGQAYHVATLDNDAPTIFAGTASFVARVTTA